MAAIPSPIPPRKRSSQRQGSGKEVAHSNTSLPHVLARDLVDTVRTTATVARQFKFRRFGTTGVVSVLSRDREVYRDESLPSMSLNSEVDTLPPVQKSAMHGCDEGAVKTGSHASSAWTPVRSPDVRRTIRVFIKAGIHATLPAIAWCSGEGQHQIILSTYQR